MPSGPKKRRAQKKKKEAAAEREISENEAPPIASSKVAENSPVMHTESTDGVTAVFDVPSVVLPKRTVLPEKMFPSLVLDFKGKDTEECIKGNALLTEIYSNVQSLNVAEPLETSQADKINVVVESSVVSAPCVTELDSQNKDGGSIMLTDVCDFEGKETKGSIECPVHTEICSIVLVSEPYETRPAEETDAVAIDAIEHLQVDDRGLVMASYDAALSVLMDNSVGSFTTDPCDLYLNAAETFNGKNAVSTNVNTAVDAVEIRGTAAMNVEDAQGKTEEAFQVCEVEVAVQNIEGAIRADVNDIKKNTLEPILENIQVNVSPKEVVALEKTEKAVQIDEVDAAMENQEDAIREDANEFEKSALESAPKDQITANEIDALENIEEAVLVDELEAVIAAKPAVNYRTHDAVITQLVTPEVGKQLKEIKELVEDVLNRLNAIDGLLPMC